MNTRPKTLDHTPPDTLAEEFRSLVEARRLLAEAEARSVMAARRNGWSWTKVGAALGVTKQSAWERFRHLTAGDPAGTVAA